ncbi:hypothetical protein EBS02_07650, partial [bacterium]|nr:hypothetical protein [bacterium]
MALHGKHSRQKSVDLAIKKLTGKAKVSAKEEVEYLDELKKDNGILSRYKTKATASAKAADEQGNFEKGNKRFSGVVLATKKQLGHGVKVPATEETKKDPREYGFEGDMAMSQLRSIMNHAQQLLGMLQPDMDLPEWVQSKITLAQDYVETAANYMQTELQKEAVNPYAVGMAQAMKSTGDTPPLKKSTIIKAHEIAKKIEAKEENSLFANMLTKLEEGRKKGSKNKPKGENLNTDGKEAEYPGLAMQLAKHADRGELGHGMIEFMDKSKHKISPEHRDLAIRKMSSLTGAGKSPDVRDKMIRDAS